MSAQKAGPGTKMLAEVETFLKRYVSFQDAETSFALSLWTAATFLWPHFDAFPYMLITSETKRSGKTRLSELLSFACSNPFNATGVTPATVFHKIRDDKPVMFIDEAESLSSDAADVMRAVMNAGYRNGQVVPRMGKGGVVEEWPVYCPKVFILIGDTTDTLRDRAIIIKMKRAEAPSRFLYAIAQGEGAAIRENLSAMVFEMKERIMAAYYNAKGLPFLQDRDEEIWMPLYAIASVMCPERMDDFVRLSVDMATIKTLPIRKHTTLAGAEQDAQAEEYRDRLLCDVGLVLKEAGTKAIGTAELLKALHALATGPWRKFRGTGLDAMDMANLLKTFGVEPKLVRFQAAKRGVHNGKVARGYSKKDVDAALKSNNLHPSTTL